MKQPSDRKYHFIYKIRCLVTNKYYIGIHSTDDCSDAYFGSGVLITRSIKKYGKDQHIKEILEYLPTRDALIQREEQLVTTDLIKNDILCMNLIKGGGGNNREYGFTEKARKLCAAAAKAAWASGLHDHLRGLPQSPISIAKRIAKNTGKKRSEEQLINLKMGQEKYYKSVDSAVLKERGKKASKTRAERGTNVGGRPKGIPMSDEQKARQSRMSKGKPLSEYHKLALKKPKAKVCCIECKREISINHFTRFHKKCD